MGFDTVTELPGFRAHKDQIDAIRTRYEWASQFTTGKTVLEIACGSGIGLGMIGKHAKTVIGGDVDKTVLKYASDYYIDRNIQVQELDACQMAIPDNSIDVAICFEAIYYFPSMARFFTELNRIIRKDGIFLCCTVNPQWHGFNPSPHSNKYYTKAEFCKQLETAGYDTDTFVGFYDKPDGLKSTLVGFIRRIAVSLKIVPKTMKGKEILKRIFYGNLKPLPSEINDTHGNIQELLNLKDDTNISNYKYIYFLARKC